MRALPIAKNTAGHLDAAGSHINQIAAMRWSIGEVG
jgi:hypothetical protein